MSIQALLQAKFSCRAIARQLNFHHSSVCREVIRGKACPTVSPANYRAGRAQARSGARRRAAGASRRKLGADVKTPLWRTVLSGLRCRWSPEQIACKLPHMNKAVMLVNPVLPDKTLSVSHETIYCAIYAMPRDTLRSELVALLRKSHKTRLPRTRGSEQPGDLADRLPVAHSHAANLAHQSHGDHLFSPATKVGRVGRSPWSIFGRLHPRWLVNIRPTPTTLVLGRANAGALQPLVSILRPCTVNEPDRPGR